MKATLDFWDDQIDVYRVYVHKGQRLKLGLDGPAGATSNLLLWKPGTKSVNDLRRQNLRAAQSIGAGAVHKVAYRVRASGWYYIEAKIVSKSFGAYTLRIARK